VPERIIPGRTAGERPYCRRQGRARARQDLGRAPDGSAAVNPVSPRERLTGSRHAKHVSPRAAGQNIRRSARLPDCSVLTPSRYRMGRSVASGSPVPVRTVGGSQGPPDHLVAGATIRRSYRGPAAVGVRGLLSAAGPVGWSRPWDLCPWPAWNALRDHPPRHLGHGPGPGPRSRMQVKSAGR